MMAESSGSGGMVCFPCPYCGKSIPITVSDCRFCGVIITAKDRQAALQKGRDAVPPPEPRRGSSKAP